METLIIFTIISPKLYWKNYWTGSFSWFGDRLDLLDLLITRIAYDMSERGNFLVPAFVLTVALCNYNYWFDFIEFANQPWKVCWPYDLNNSCINCCISIDGLRLLKSSEWQPGKPLRQWYLLKCWNIWNGLNEKRYQKHLGVVNLGSNTIFLTNSQFLTHFVETLD